MYIYIYIYRRNDMQTCRGIWASRYVYMPVAYIAVEVCKLASKHGRVKM